MIWALGGHAFLLRRAMRQSGFDQIIRGVLEGGAVYGGWSAGACVAATCLRAIALMDDPAMAAPGYGEGDVVWDGLGLVPGAIIPHYDSDHQEAEAAARAVDWAVAHGIAHTVLRDGEVLIVDEYQHEVLPRPI